eukprot:TRINITY_DN1769_c0_g1_i1.p1 TRINITY_DN1769_c0_g1~~TRINITY_DN1769_c0_g1_i1.p1  ORF type:complete len:440 (-),score=70.60 TRINITY_DN1769_c0_g1_i1:94-1413(-)
MQLLKNRKAVLWSTAGAVVIVLVVAILVVVLRHPKANSSSGLPPTPPSSNFPVLDVFQFGAVGDGVTDDTNAIQSALNACNATGCVVWLPPTGRFYSYPVSIMKDNTILQIDGEIILPPFGEAQKSWKQTPESFIPWLTIQHRYPGEAPRGVAAAQNIVIQGWGRINGQGSSWWGTHEGRERPILIYLLHAQNLVLKDLTLFQAPYFHVVPEAVHFMSIYNLTIMTNGTSPNTDGIDPRLSSNIHIYNTTISNGDDCVAIKTNCFNILVENSTFINGHGASIGSTAGTSHNITFRNIVFHNTSYGVRIKSRNEDPGVISNIVYTNLEMHRVKYAVHITQFYLPTNSTRANNTICNVTISNIVAQDTTDATFVFDCSDNRPCTGFRLSNIHSTAESFPSRYLYKCVSFQAQYSDISPSLPPVNRPPKGLLTCPPSSSSSF